MARKPKGNDPRVGVHRGGRPPKPPRAGKSEVSGGRGLHLEIWKPKGLHLESLPEVRRSLAELMAGFRAHTVSEMELRALVYAGRAVADCLVEERDMRLEDQLEALAEKVAALEQKAGGVR